MDLENSVEDGVVLKKVIGKVAGGGRNNWRHY